MFISHHPQLLYRVIHVEEMKCPQQAESQWHDQDETSRKQKLKASITDYPSLTNQTNNTLIITDE